VSLGGDGSEARSVVFVSYSRHDAEWRRRFEEMLAPVVRNRSVEVWIDERNEGVGCVWRAELADAIARSTIALLLVTPPFLASEFIMDTELDALIDHGVRLAPALVRPCLWRDEPRLEERQFLLDPGQGAIAGAADEEGRIMRACAKLGEYLPPPRVPGPRLRVPVGRLGAVVLSAALDGDGGWV
jgi:hypothetical protein